MDTNPDRKRISKFEVKGLGKAPYRCLGVWSAPSKSLMEHNPEAFNMAWREAPKLSDGFHLTTCAHCGTNISDAYIVKSGDGLLFAVGSSCAGKIGDTILDIDKEIRELRNKKARERNRAKSKENWDRSLAMHARTLALVEESGFSEYLESLPSVYRYKGTKKEEIIYGSSIYHSLREQILNETLKLKEEYESKKKNA